MFPRDVASVRVCNGCKASFLEARRKERRYSGCCIVAILFIPFLLIMGVIIGESRRHDYDDHNDYGYYHHDDDYYHRVERITAKDIHETLIEKGPDGADVYTVHHIINIIEDLADEEEVDLNPNYQEIIRNGFNTIDTDKDGSITRQQMISLRK